MRWSHRIAVVAMCMASQAHAHALLQRAAPPAGSRIATPPHQIVLMFTEAVEPSFSTIELRDPHGAALAIGALRTANGGRELIADLPQLGSGRYSVIWHATSVDTHKTEGSYQFTIAP